MKCEVVYRSVPREGEQANGDAVFTRSVDGVTLVALVDALGHGLRAAQVAATALEALASFDVGASAGDHVHALHHALRGTRGAAALVLRIELEGGHDAQLEACSVGNVDLRSCHTRLPVVLSPGVLGVRLAKARVFHAALGKWERLIAFSDGISSRFEVSGVAEGAPQAACELLLNERRRRHDDATVAIIDVR